MNLKMRGMDLITLKKGMIMLKNLIIIEIENLKGTIYLTNLLKQKIKSNWP